MTSNLRLNSYVEIVGKMPAFSSEIIRNERSLAWSTIPNARLIGGPITNAFVDSLPKEWCGSDVTIQVKMTWLKNGWLAGEMGFHCDWLDNNDLNNPWPQAVAAVVGECAMTRFIHGSIELPIMLGQPEQMERWREPIASAVRANSVQEIQVKSSELFRFGPQSLHSRSYATESGWRVILRAFRSPDDMDPHPWNTYWDTVQNDCEPSSDDEKKCLSAYGSYSAFDWAQVHERLMI